VEPGEPSRQRRQRLALSPRARQAVQSVALGALMASIAVAAIELSRWHPHSKPLSPIPAASSSALESAPPSFGHDQRLVPVPPEPALTEAPQTSPAPSLLRATVVPPRRAKFEPAAELFAEANRARARGDAQQAIAISELLESTFPNTSEGIATHLSLGVLYLQQAKPSLALQEFKIYRHIGSSERMAEALWGEAQVLQQLGRTSEERAALEELLQSYPRSAYAAAAEKRVAALNN
jgi:Outer membrane lipoprotein